MLLRDTEITSAMARQFHRAAGGPSGPIDPAAVAAAQDLRRELEHAHGARIGSIYTRHLRFGQDPASWGARQARLAAAHWLDWGPGRLTGAAPLECSAE